MQDDANITANSTVSIFEPLDTKKKSVTNLLNGLPQGLKALANASPELIKKKSRNTGIPSSAAVERLFSRS